MDRWIHRILLLACHINRSTQLTKIRIIGFWSHLFQNKRAVSRCCGVPFVIGLRNLSYHMTNFLVVFWLKGTLWLPYPGCVRALLIVQASACVMKFKGKFCWPMTDWWETTYLTFGFHTIWCNTIAWICRECSRLARVWHPCKS